MLTQVRGTAALLCCLLLGIGGVLTEAQETSSVHMIAVEGEGAGYWPRWRGPSGQGHVADTGYPDHWSDTENVIWRTRLSGRGNSSPIVWDDQIFLTTAQEGGRRLVVMSFSRDDGRLLWETEAPGTFVEHVHQKNTQASGTPTTDGERLFMSFGSRGLLALDLDGAILWHRDVGRIANYHGSAGSPLLYDDKVIIYQDQRGGSFVAAFDAATGDPVWRVSRDASVGWGSPVAIRVGDHDEVIVNSQRTVNAYDPATGEELWRCGGMTFEVIPTPAVGAGLVFCASGRAGPTLAIRPGGRGDVTATHIAWRTSRGSPFVPSPLVHGGYLYTINDMSSVVTCFEAASGEVMWQQRLGRPSRESFSASPVVVDGKIFFTNDGGQTFVVRAGPEFELLHTNDIGAPTLASPALVDGRWYVRTSRELIAIGEEH